MGSSLSHHDKETFECQTDDEWLSLRLEKAPEIRGRGRSVHALSFLHLVAAAQCRG